MSKYNHLTLWESKWALRFSCSAPDIMKLISCPFHSLVLKWLNQTLLRSVFALCSKHFSEVLLLCALCYTFYPSIKPKAAGHSAELRGHHHNPLKLLRISCNSLTLHVPHTWTPQSLLAPILGCGKNECYLLCERQRIKLSTFVYLLSSHWLLFFNILLAILPFLNLFL